MSPTARSLLLTTKLTGGPPGGWENGSSGPVAGEHASAANQARHIAAVKLRRDARQPAFQSLAISTRLGQDGVNGNLLTRDLLPNSGRIQTIYVPKHQIGLVPNRVWVILLTVHPFAKRECHASNGMRRIAVEDRNLGPNTRFSFRPSVGRRFAEHSPATYLKTSPFVLTPAFAR